MNCKVADIVKGVRVILDYNQQEDTLEGFGTDTINLDELINEQIVPGAKQILLTAPKEYIDWDNAEEPTLTYDENLRAITFDLPERFLRLGVAKLDNWKVPVHDYIGADSMEYLMQLSPFAGVRASELKPVLAIVEGLNMDTTSGVVQMFGANEDSRVECFLYANEPYIAGGELYYVSIKLYYPTLYMIASFVAESLKDTQKSETLRKMAINLMTNAEALEQVKRNAVQEQ